MALLMVISAIALLTWMLANFTFETKLNKLKIYNFQDKVQAKLTAESGLHYAIGMLRIYQEARNLLVSNKKANQFIKPSDLESALIGTPLKFPIPLPEGSNAIQKSALQEFEKENLLRGELLVTISPVIGFLNPNRLRIPEPKKGEEENRNQQSSEEEEKKKPHIYIGTKFVELIKNTIEDQKEKDEDFEKEYPNIDPELLVQELRYFVNSPQALNESDRAQVEDLYRNENIRAKHGPLSSLEEMYQLVGWPAEIINLIKKRLTVHEAQTIPVNKIDRDQLRLIFPTISDEQSEEFFRYRDGDEELKEEPNPFKDVKEFKALIVGNLAILQEAEYDDRIKELEQAGLKIGLAGKLFKVMIDASFQRAKYKMTAFIDLPIKPVIKKEKKETKNPSQVTTGTSSTTSANQNTQGQGTQKEEDKEPPQLLLIPRVVEIIIGQ